MYETASSTWRHTQRGSRQLAAVKPDKIRKVVMAIRKHLSEIAKRGVATADERADIDSALDRTFAYLRQRR